MSQITNDRRYRVNTRSLSFQLLSRSLLVLAVLLLLIGVLQYVWMKDFLYENEAETLYGNRMIPPNVLTPDEETPTRPIPARDPVLFFEDTAIAHIKRGGGFTDISGDNGGTPSPRLADEQYAAIMDEPREQERHNQYDIVQGLDGEEMLIVFRHAGLPGELDSLIQIGKPTAPLKAVVMRQLSIFAVLSLAALAGGLALSLPLLRRTLNPLRRMVSVVEKIDAGNLDVRFSTGDEQTEIERLTTSFNGMLGRLQLSFAAEREAKEQMRRFIADASHELRTPLTSIHGFLEVLLRGAADNKEQLYAALRSMHGESARLKKLVEDLLALAKLDRAPELQRVVCRLDTLLIEMEPHLRILGDQRKVTLQLEEQISGVYDSDKLKQIIINLFQNAVQHTDPQLGSISLALRKEGNDALLSVADNGVGIAEEHLPRVFDRFYRADHSRTRRSGGAGLGLSISRSIAEAHGGKIEAISKLGEGSVFTVRLPL